MAVPSFLSTEFGHTEIAVTTDVQDIIDQLVIDLLALTNPWTHNAGVFTSPTDSGGNFVKITLVRDSATRLRALVNDRDGRNLLGTGVIERSMDIVAAGDRIQIFYGENYLWIESLNPTANAAEGEHIGCGILDLSPELQDANDRNIWARARRTSAGTADASGDSWADIYMIEAANNGVVRTRPIRIADHLGTVINHRRMSGRLIYLPVEIMNVDNISAPRMAGRMYQAFQVNGRLEPWSEVEIPIDDSPQTLGTFKVSNCRESSTGDTTRIAFRVA